MKAFAWLASVFASKAVQAPVAPVAVLSPQELTAVSGGLPRVGGLDITTEAVAVPKTADTPSAA